LAGFLVGLRSLIDIENLKGINFDVAVNGQKYAFCFENASVAFAKN